MVTLRNARPLMVARLFRIGPHVRLDERRYFSVFLFAQHTLVPQIFVADKRAFPIAMIGLWFQPPRPDCDDRSDPNGHQQPEQDGTEKKRLHGTQPLSGGGSPKKCWISFGTPMPTWERPYYGRWPQRGSRKIPHFSQAPQAVAMAKPSASQMADSPVCDEKTRLSAADGRLVPLWVACCNHTPCQSLVATVQPASPAGRTARLP